MAFGALLFVVFVRRAGLADVAAGVASVGWGFLLVLALSGFRFAMRALAWTLCVEPPGRLTFREALVATVAGDALGNVTPLGLLVSEPAKVALVTRRLPAAGALAALAVENLFYSLSVAVVLVAGLVALVVRLGTGTGWWLAAGLIVGGVVLAVLALHAVLWRRVSLSARLLVMLPERWAAGWVGAGLGWLRRLEARMHAAYPRTKAGLGPIAMVDALFHVAALAETYVVLAFVTGSSPSWLDAFLFESVNRMIMVAFKFVPLRVGVDEAGTGLFADLLQFGTVTGVTMAIVRKARMLSWLAIGLPIVLGRGLSATRADASTTPTASVVEPTRTVIAIMARSPSDSGAIKTRLASVVPDPRVRADLYAAFVADTVRTCRAIGGVALRLAYTPDGGTAGFDAAGLWPDELLAQRGDDLGTRERALFEDLFSAGFDRALVIGSDLPTLPSRVLEEAVASLAAAGDAVIGPSDDGGYCLLGLAAAEPIVVPDLFTGVRWSTPFALADTLSAARRAGIDLVQVESWYDVDDAGDLERLRKELAETPTAAPATAAALAKIE
jgi:hypothetical protein|tara:strand:- start:1378 stop:3045 length:1668 start_codon:yes stop_codon:yes gene_type:complete